MIDAEAAGTSVIAARATSASRRSVRTWWKLLLNPILRRFGWSFVSTVDMSTGSVLRHELRRYPDHCRVLDDPVTIHDLPPGMSRTGDGWAVWPFERCKSPECRGRRVTVGFEVSDEDWDAVMGGEPENVVCLTCFDERAQRKGVRYTLIEMHPVGWFDADDVIEVDAQCDPNGLRGRSQAMVWADDASFVPPAMPVVPHDPIWNPRPGPRFK